MLRFYQLFGKEQVLIADPQAIRHVLVTNSTNYTRSVGKAIKELAPYGLLGLDALPHRSERKLLNHSFSSQTIIGKLELPE